MSHISELRQKGFTGDVVTPDDATYDKAISRWAINSSRRAEVVTFPKDASDVVRAIQYAKENNLPLAVCCGGHSSSGASSVEGGLVIDLSRYLNEVRIDTEKQLGYVGGGCLWKDVDETAIKYGLATVGGTVQHTGVGGLIAGGGYGFLSGQHGLAIDNLVQATVVLAEGKIVTANETSNPDLYWGIRGGGGNFGVITEFVLKLHPQRKTVFAGFVTFPGNRAEEVFKGLANWWNSGPTSKDCAIAFAHRSGNPSDSQYYTTICLFYNGSEEEGRQRFKWAFDLGPVADTAKEIPYEVLNSLQNPFARHGSNVYLTGTSQGAPHPHVAVAICEMASKLPQDAGLELAAVFEYFPMDKILQVPQTATAFALREKRMNILTTVRWDVDAPGKTELARDWADKVKGIVAAGEEGMTRQEVEARVYPNYDAETTVKADRTAALFRENYPRLQQLKKKYDPLQIFNKWHPIALPGQ